MEVEKLLQLVEKRRHKEFLHFVETGEAEEPFLTYLNGDANAQRAVDMAFSAQAESFESLARELSVDQTTTSKERLASVTIADAIEKILGLSPEQRENAFQQTASVLEASLEADQRGELDAVVVGLEKTLKKVATAPKRDTQPRSES